VNRAAWHLRANAPVAGWLLAVLVVSFVHPLVQQPRWLLVHLLLLGAVTNAILVWSAHFTEALLRSAPRRYGRRGQAARLVGLNVCVVLVLGGVVTGRWPVTLVGAVGLAAVVLWHAGTLLGQLRAALPSRFGTTVHYYVAAAATLPVGAGLGTLLARGPSPEWHSRLVVAHTAVNLLGWVGLTVVGTLVTLWPTMLRTRVADGAERAAAGALRLLMAALLLTAGGAVLGLHLVVAVGVSTYVAGLVVAGRPLLAATRQRPADSYATWSVLAGCTWLLGTLVAVAVGIGTADGWATAAGRAGWVTLPLAVGFAGQVLLGALSYLVPTVLGGGPSAVRAATTELSRAGALRISVVNAGLLLCVLPTPGLVRVSCSLLVLGGLAAFLPLLARSVHASRIARARPTDAARLRERDGSASPFPHHRPTGMLTGGLMSVVLAVAVGVALDPAAVARTEVTAAAAGVAASGRTTEVRVEARDMRFTPATVRVPAGDRLVVVVTNTDDDNVHDLVLETGPRTARLAPGESDRIDVGVVGRDLEGWCSVVGHRQLGMVLTVDVTDATAHDPDAGSATPAERTTRPGADFIAHDATLPRAEDRSVHRLTLTVREVERELAPGVRQRQWTYNGSAPGPTLRGKVGDVFDVTLVNDGSIGHSVDFHAGSLAPDRPTRTISPGESLRYRFTARRSGIWLYHCSTMPMSAHIANGMFGAVIIDPPSLPQVDREYLLVQSESYLGADEVDPAKVAAEAPDLVTFNGYADQYRHRPLTARVGERVRIWALAAGPNRGTALHVVGAQFDTVFSDGAYLVRRGNEHRGGSQVLALAPAQGGYVELTFPEAGRYPFVSHAMVDAERGAAGVFEISR